jgi:hypothetical protein
MIDMKECLNICRRAIIYKTMLQAAEQGKDKA